MPNDEREDIVKFVSSSKQSPLESWRAIAPPRLVQTLQICNNKSERFPVVPSLHRVVASTTPHVSPTCLSWLIYRFRIIEGSRCGNRIECATYPVSYPNSRPPEATKAPTIMAGADEPATLSGLCQPMAIAMVVGWTSSIQGCNFVVF